MVSPAFFRFRFNMTAFALFHSKFLAASNSMLLVVPGYYVGFTIQISNSIRCTILFYQTDLFSFCLYFQCLKEKDKGRIAVDLFPYTEFRMLYTNWLVLIKHHGQAMKPRNGLIGYANASLGHC
jgi:hypothetical protein